MRDLYISVEALRNSMDLLSSRVTEWVCQQLRFCEPRGQAWKDQQQEFWQLLAVEPMTMDLLVDELELCWSDGHLCIMQSAQVGVGSVVVKSQLRLY